jgi:hypothetical protein
MENFREGNLYTVSFRKQSKKPVHVGNVKYSRSLFET